MNTRLVVGVMCLFGLLGGVGPGVAENRVDDNTPPEKQSKAAQYRERATKRMEFNECYQEGLPQCYKQFQEAVEWCNQNWKRCFPLIDGTGAHASNYGGQILRDCKKQLKHRCRKKAGF